jgi:chondroitin 4-sulfotransferase 11
LFLRQGGFNSADQRRAAQHLGSYHDFGAFVRDRVTPDNIRCRVHFRPQTDYLPGTSGVPDTDFIGRFEYLEADFEQVCDRLDIHRRLLDFNINNRGKQFYRDFYDAETRELVADVYRQDVIRRFSLCWHQRVAFDRPLGSVPDWH